MAVWHIDNFKGWGLVNSINNQRDCVTAMLQGIYTASNRGALGSYLRVVADPQNPNENCLILEEGAGNSPYIRIAHPDGPQTEMGARVRLYIPSLITSNQQRPIEFLDASNSSLIYIWFDFIGRANVVTNSATYTTPAPVITAGGWYTVELKFDQTDFELQIEASTVLGPQAHGISTPAPAQFQVQSQGDGTTSETFYIKDLVCTDGNGSYNTGWIGTKLIRNFDLTADAQLNWTPSTGSTGHNLLQKTGPDDTTYISAGTGPIPSPYRAVLSTLPADATSVAAVLTRVRALKSDGGDGSMQVGVVADPSGAANVALGEDRPITTTATYWQDVFEEDPSTSAGWSVSSVNDIQLQINRTT